MSGPTPLRFAVGTAVICWGLAVCAPMFAQQPVDTTTPQQPDSIEVIAGARYRAGGLHRLLFGAHHRELWTTPIQAPILDLGRFAGGVTPLQRGGGKQTRSLRLQGADGRVYVFRSIDKDPTASWPEELRNTVAARFAEDQTSALHPAAAAVVSALLDAAEVLHASPRLVWMPDDPRLGEFRAEFGGSLGWLEERPQGGDDEAPAFADAVDVESTEDLFKKLENNPAHRVDARRYLAARLMDLFLGDWDRHADQWRWARYDDGKRRRWVPIPRDRDWALNRIDGFLLSIARMYQPKYVSFGREYGSIYGLTLNAQPLDRRILAELERPVWDSVVTALGARLDDAAIDEAVARLPAGYRRLAGDELAATLRARRDGLPTAAAEFYRLLASHVDIRATDESDLAEIDRLPTGGVEVRLAAGGEMYFRRRFVPDETKEIRVYLHGDDDRAVVRGGGNGIVVRVIGGGGDDRLIDSLPNGGRAAHFYDDRGDNTFVAAPGTTVDTRPWTPPVDPDTLTAVARDWGSWWTAVPWLNSGPQIGLFLGLGAIRYGYGFRAVPYSSRLVLRAGYATGLNAVRAELLGELRRPNSDVTANLLLRASGVEIVRFYGFGNETPSGPDDDFYRAAQHHYVVAPAVSFTAATARVTAGPILKYVSTDLDDDRLLGQTRPYGVPGFGQIGAEASVALDRRDRPVAATRGFAARATGTYYPGVWDARRPFGAVQGEAMAFLSPALPLEPTLALRAGAKRVWGNYPLHEAAFVGGATTVRGIREQRYAGDAAVFGNAELRLFLARMFVVLPLDFGVFGLLDAGRVYYEGESSDRWHTGGGGGIWFSVLGRGNTLSLAAARGDDRTAFYLRGGFGF